MQTPLHAPFGHIGFCCVAQGGKSPKKELRQEDKNRSQSYHYMKLRFNVRSLELEIKFSSIFGMDRTRTHFGLGFFAFSNSSWKTTPSVKKLHQKGQSKGQL